jgi:hypothetical protein
MSRISSHISIGLMTALALGAFATVGAGCGKKQGADKAATGDKPATDKPAADKPAAGGGGAVKLAKLGLQLDAPGEVTVGDAIVGDGQMVQGGGIGALTVEVAKTPQTLDEAKEDAKMYTPANLKADTLPDGWALTFDNKGSAGSNFFVDVRRTIDGKLIKCSTTGSDAGQAAAVLAACKSLRKS